METWTGVETTQDFPYEAPDYAYQLLIDDEIERDEPTAHVQSMRAVTHCYRYRETLIGLDTYVQGFVVSSYRRDYNYEPYEEDIWKPAVEDFPAIWQAAMADFEFENSPHRHYLIQAGMIETVINVALLYVRIPFQHPKVGGITPIISAIFLLLYMTTGTTVNSITSSRKNLKLT